MECTPSVRRHHAQLAAHHQARLLARKLAVDRYRQLFSNRYWRNVDGSYQEFPPLEETNFVVEEEGDAFVVTCAPLRGYHVQARVAKTGAWVELINVGYAAH